MCRSYLGIIITERTEDNFQAVRTSAGTPIALSWRKIISFIRGGFLWHTLFCSPLPTSKQANQEKPVH
jgi:hypothetical protein